MRSLLTMLLITLQSTTSDSQAISFEFKKICFQGLSFESSKDEIIEAFGIPKIVDPEY
jgi:inhibitor of KinA sporulation pathway (predicted exonuclease)